MGRARPALAAFEAFVPRYCKVAHVQRDTCTGSCGVVHHCQVAALPRLLRSHDAGKQYVVTEGAHTRACVCAAPASTCGAPACCVLLGGDFSNSKLLAD